MKRACDSGRQVLKAHLKNIFELLTEILWRVGLIGSDRYISEVSNDFRTKRTNQGGIAKFSLLSFLDRRLFLLQILF